VVTGIRPANAVKAECGHTSARPFSASETLGSGAKKMKSVGIREAKARISELARAAAKGEATILTDYGKPVAMVGPLEQTTVEETGSDAGEFRKALLSLPYHLDLGF
jgi:antitoxin (DNA-binding transcriptional repressor) of toxin-antitoxin stability system